MKSDSLPFRFSSLRLAAWAAAGLLALAPLAAPAAIERSVIKTFPAKAGGLLTLTTNVGPIQVDSAAGDTVRVVVREKINAASDAEADQLLQRVRLEFSAADGNVTVTARNEQSNASFWGSFFGGTTPVQLEFTVTVPAHYNVKLNTSGGRIGVGALTGDVRADTSGGSLTFGDITGNLYGRTSGGGIRIASCTGRTDVDTSGGGIEAGTLRGPAHLSTSGGSIAVRRAENTVYADTSGGGITVTFAGPLQGDCNLDTSAGGIHVKVDRTAAFNLRADTSAGRVQCALPVNAVRGRPDSDHLEGPVNGGGPLLRLDTSAGSIHIDTND